MKQAINVIVNYPENMESLTERVTEAHYKCIENRLKQYPEQFREKLLQSIINETSERG